MAQIVGPKRPALPRHSSGYELDTLPEQPDIIDVLTLGDETTVFRPVQRALMGSGWVVRHAGRHAVSDSIARDEQSRSGDPRHGSGLGGYALCAGIAAEPT